MAKDKNEIFRMQILDFCIKASLGTLPGGVWKTKTQTKHTRNNPNMHTYTKSLRYGWSSNENNYNPKSVLQQIKNYTVIKSQCFQLN